MKLELHARARIIYVYARTRTYARSIDPPAPPSTTTRVRTPASCRFGRPVRRGRVRARSLERRRRSLRPPLPGSRQHPPRWAAPSSIEFRERECCSVAGPRVLRAFSYSLLEVRPPAAVPHLVPGVVEGALSLLYTVDGGECAAQNDAHHAAARRHGRGEHRGGMHVGGSDRHPGF